MMKTKDYKINFIEGQDDYTFSAKNKNAIYLKGLTKDDIDKTSFKIVGGNLLFSTLDGKNYTVSNYSSVKYIKTNIVGSTKTELLNIISNNLVDNSANVISQYNPRKRTITATNYNDVINAKLSGYIVPNDGNNRNKGLIIKAGSGNDTITGTLGADSITGGAGKTVINYAKGDGNDVIYLTKGENFTLNFTDLTKEDLRFEFVNKNKDLRIYTSETSNDEYVTLKNFVNKDVTNNSNSKKNKVDSSSVEIIFNNIESSRIDLRTAIDLYKKEITKNYTGSWLSENITAEDYIKYAWYKTEEGSKELLEVEDWSKKGLTIKAGGGKDSIIGSNYSDTIKGGSGNDTITGGWGDDKLTGNSGNNTFVFSLEDGADTIKDAKLGDVIQITDVFAEELNYYRDGNNLVIHYNDDFYDANKIIVQNYFKSNNKIERLIAQDKEVLISEESRNYGIIGSGTLKGDDEDNTIRSNGKNNVKIYGNKGNDIIYANSKKSTIYFYEGDGKDTIVDYSYEDCTTSSNTLVFKAGTKLSFESKLSVTDYSYRRASRDLIISYGNSGDTVTIKDYYEEDNSFYIKIGNTTKKLSSMYKVPQDIYVSGEGQTYEGTDNDEIVYVQAKRKKKGKTPEDNEVTIQNNTVHAKGGNDCILIGRNSQFDIILNNTIYAEEGNDYIDGTDGSNNTIYLGEGDDIFKGDVITGGFNTIYDESGDDKILLSANITKNDVILKFDLAVDEDGNIIENSSKDMYIVSSSDFKDTDKGIKVANQFVEGHAVETIVVSPYNDNKYQITTTQINQLRQNVAGWLHTNHFESVQQIIESNDTTKIQNLITEFQKADWQLLDS